MKILRMGLLIVGFSLLFFMCGVLAQAPSKYQPSEVQSLRLQLALKNAQLAQRDAQDANQRFQNSLRDLNVEGEKVRVENKWPDTVKFDAGTMTFVEPPPPPAPAKKEEEPPKP